MRGTHNFFVISHVLINNDLNLIAGTVVPEIISLPRIKLRMQR